MAAELSYERAWCSLYCSIAAAEGLYLLALSMYSTPCSLKLLTLTDPLLECYLLCLGSNF